MSKRNKVRMKIQFHIKVPKEVASQYDILSYVYLIIAVFCMYMYMGMKGGIVLYSGFLYRDFNMDLFYSSFIFFLRLSFLHHLSVS